jgi:hypothetical protein
MSAGIRSGFYEPGVVPWASSRYYFVPPSQNPGTTTTHGIGTLRATPCDVPNAVTITRFGSEVTVIGDAGSKIRLGIYADDGTNRPGVLILDAGQIAGDSATVQELTGLSVTIGPGRYWFAAVVQSVTVTQPTLRTTTNTPYQIEIPSGIPGTGTALVGLIHSSTVSGALPSAFTVGTSIASTVARMFIKT